MQQYVVCALYKFVHLENFKDIRQPLLETMEKYDVRGTLLLAHEGINGTVASTQKGIQALLKWLANDERLNLIETKESFTSEMPFKRTKVKLKKEIVTMGVEDIDPNHIVGTYVEPKDWNALIDDPDVLLIDTRNDYEVAVGTFKDAINPHTTTFREFPKYVQDHLETSKHKKVAMYCTGGIRCEKSTAYLKQNGFEEVYHLKGGILKYLEEVPEASSQWEGECFVFDDRVTVNHDLEKGSYDQCNACRLPITDDDKLSSFFVQGVSCPSCYAQTTEEQKQRYAQREKQIQLAKQRGEEHIGSGAATMLAQKQEKKRKLQLEKQPQ